MTVQPISPQWLRKGKFEVKALPLIGRTALALPVGTR
jgi:hypothetical protein